MIRFLTLTDGGQKAEQVAGWVADFLSPATRSLELALYDLDLGPNTAPPVVDALHRAVERGVQVRLASNVDYGPGIAVPPPPKGPPDWPASLRVPYRAISGVPHLMHQKYAVRDGEDVWTGSTNWTEDSWTREENVVCLVRSPDVAAAYARDFQELWQSGRVGGSGKWTLPPLDVGGRPVRVWFSPGRGKQLGHRIAKAIGTAERRVRVGSPVITSGPILAALAEAVDGGQVDVAGVVDATQLRQVLHAWTIDRHGAWKTPLLHQVVAGAPFAGKASTPYGVGTVHDFMHAKVTVADDTTFVGSYNLSRAGQDNAENVLEIHDPNLAEQMAAFVDALRGRYPPFVPA